MIGLRSAGGSFSSFSKRRQRRASRARPLLALHARRKAFRDSPSPIIENITLAAPSETPPSYVRARHTGGRA